MRRIANCYLETNVGWGGGGGRKLRYKYKIQLKAPPSFSMNYDAKRGGCIIKQVQYM